MERDAHGIAGIIKAKSTIVVRFIRKRRRFVITLSGFPGDSLLPMENENWMALLKLTTKCLIISMR